MNSPLKLTSDLKQENTDGLQASGIIDLDAISSTKSNDINALSKITYAVIETSVSFEYNSSLMQNTDSINCTDIKSDQIVSNVIMISMDVKYNSLQNFVKTQFRTHPVKAQDNIFKLN